MATGPTTQGTAPPGRGTTLLLAGSGLALVATCYGLARFGYGLFVPAFRSSFGVDATTSGAIAAASYVAYCAAIVASALLTPRWGGRAVAVAAGCLATGGTALIAAAPDVVALAVGVIIAGASTGAASPPLAHAIARTVPGPRQNRVQTIVNAGTGVGVLVSGPVALLAQGDWRTAWWVFALLCAAATIAVAVSVPGRSTPGTRAPDVLPRPLVPPGAGRLLLAAGAVGVASSAVWTFARDVVVTVGRLDERQSVVMWVLLGAFGLLGAAAGDLVARLGLRRAWGACLLLVAGATGAFAVAPGDAVVVDVAAAAFGAAYIALTGLLLVWATDVYAQQPAAGVGAAFLAIALGQAVGAPLLGAVADAAGPPAAFTTAAVLAALGALARPPRAAAD